MEAINWHQQPVDWRSDDAKTCFWGALRGQIAARRQCLGHLFFGCLDASEQRQLASVIVVDAYAEIDFSWILVSDKRFGDAEDRVFGNEFNAGEKLGGHDQWGRR